MKASRIRRRLPVGAEVQPSGGVHFRVWAPGHKKLEVVLDGPGSGDEQDSFPLEPEKNGYFSAVVDSAGDGTCYRFRVDGRGQCPDPASRWQPEGVHGSSQVVDPTLFRWSDQDWKGIGSHGQVLYEMHIGTYTQEGNWDGAIKQLPALADTGITVLEIMPVAEFPGNFGWGYDGVFMFAPTRLYGTGDDFRRFVDRAHSVGLGVILDVVYNHFGPEGNCLEQYAAHYFTDRYATDWGKAINYDGEDSGPVREFFVSNAAYWISEFHLDGLRLDATQNIYDSSKRHIIAEISETARKAAPGRSIYLVGENEPQHTRLVRPVSAGGYGLDALWNDDFHHSARVAMTGRSEAYFTDYRGTSQELLSAIRWGYLYQGQNYVWQQKRRGTPAFDLRAQNFVTFIENHDQIANSSFGKRVHELTSPGGHRAMTAFLLLSPPTPMLFQGQEFGTPHSFRYFADFSGELAKSVREGRVEFLKQFRNMLPPESQDALSDPADPTAFEECKLDPDEERSQNEPIFRLHKDLLRMRREDPVFRKQNNSEVFGAVLGPEAFLLRFFGEHSDDRLLIVNFDRDVELKPAPEPLLAPPPDCEWELIWSSESPDYGGSGVLPF
ncbi:MAG: malto-oligosyltrehalose trehalohydrolase, partial [Acidobacteria bacterium]